ncbi:bluetail domain-containing putative surface protein, partial [Cuspidothrix issatschenkoi]
RKKLFGLLVTGTITNDDTTLAITSSNAKQTEGNSGIKSFTFNVNRTGNTTGTNSVNWTVAGSGNNPANAVDFANSVFPKGTITFGANESNKVITFNVNGDTTFEQDETFTVTLSNPTNGATISTALATGTIANDDTILKDTETFKKFLDTWFSVKKSIFKGELNEIIDVELEFPKWWNSAVNKFFLSVNAGMSFPDVEKFEKEGLTKGEAWTSAIIKFFLSEVVVSAAETISKIKVSPTPSWGIFIWLLPIAAGGVASLLTNSMVDWISIRLGSEIWNLISDDKSPSSSALQSMRIGTAWKDDIFQLKFGESLISNPVWIMNFDIGKDKIYLRSSFGSGVNIYTPFNFTRAADSTATTLEKMVDSVFDDANGNFGKQPLDKNSAALVSVTTAGIAGTYLVINDGIAGFQSNQDLVVNLTGYIGTLPSLGSIDVNSFF